MSQLNFVTKHEYAGSNADTLAHVQNQNGFQSNEWLTFLQAKTVGRKILAGQKGIKLVKFLKIPATATEDEKTVPKTFVVFNVDQTNVTRK